MVETIIKLQINLQVARVSISTASLSRKATRGKINRRKEAVNADYNIINNFINRVNFNH